jgi:D-alanine transaminase
MSTSLKQAILSDLGVNTVYLNGEFVRPELAMISPFDRGFIFGDGVYEVVPVFGGRLFRLPHHLRRLRDSLAAIDLAPPLSGEQWRQVLQRLVDEAGGGDQSLYLQVTRGVAPRNHAFPKNITPTVFAYTQKKAFAAKSTQQSGAAVITAADIRWLRCDIKSTSLLAAVILREQAERAGAIEAILIRDGLVTEGAASNIFLVRDSVLITPPKGQFILPGITRDLVLELAHKHGIAVQERDVKEDELSQAQEVWITSSTNEIKPVGSINGIAVTGTPGPMYQQLYDLYERYKQAVREGRAE